MSGFGKRTALYANLLDDAPGEAEAEKGAAVDTQDDTADGQMKQKMAEVLRFQPRRPQQVANRPKQKMVLKPPVAIRKELTMPSTAAPSAAADILPASTAARQERSEQAGQSNLDKWVQADEMDGYAYDDRPARGGKRNRKKKQQDEQHHFRDWNDPYDPARPNTFEEFMQSDLRWDDADEWKQRLYAGRDGARVQQEMD